MSLNLVNCWENNAKVKRICLDFAIAKIEMVALYLHSLLIVLTSKKIKIVNYFIWTNTVLENLTLPEQQGTWSPWSPTEAAHKALASAIQSNGISSCSWRNTSRSAHSSSFSLMWRHKTSLMQARRCMASLRWRSAKIAQCHNPIDSSCDENSACWRSRFSSDRWR